MSTGPALFGRMKIFILNLLISWSGLFLNVASAIEPGGGRGQSVGAGSPFTDYTARVTVYVFLVGLLVTTVLLGGFLILNLGLLSKRPEDRVGERDPSDLGLLKTQTWPEAPYQRKKLPAEDEGYEDECEDEFGGVSAKEATPKRVA